MIKDLTRLNEQLIDHRLNDLFPIIKQYRRTRDFLSSPIYREHATALELVADGVEWANGYHGAANPHVLRVVAWNIERGRELAGLRWAFKTDPLLAEADVLLLTETDVGMGRSGNENIPRVLAEHLGMNYCFANSFIVLSKGDEGEQDHEAENTLSMHGNAILSRYPILSCQSPALPSTRDYMKSSEQRFGKRRGLICAIDIAGKRFDFGTAHLELKTSPAQRSRQLATMLAAMSRRDAEKQIFGGDLNTHTYNLTNKIKLLQSFLYKLAFVGVSETIVQYMQPDRFFERPVFQAFRQFGFNVADFNDRRIGTLYYNLGEVAASIKTRKWAPEFIFNWLKEILEPYGGEVPFRLDWLAGRGFDNESYPAGSGVSSLAIPRQFWENRKVSDHDPIGVDISLAT